MWRALIRPIWEISRTLLLMSMADRLYRDDSGALFIVEVRRDSISPPKSIRRIPDRALLDQLLQETWWSNASWFLAGAMLVLVWGFLPAGWQIVIVLLMLSLISICSRSQALVLKQCPEVLQQDYATLLLDKDPSQAGLRYVRAVMFGAVALPIAGFTIAHIIRAAASDLIETLGLQVTETAAIFSAFGSLIAAAYLIVLSGRVQSGRKLDLRGLKPSHT